MRRYRIYKRPDDKFYIRVKGLIFWSTILEPSYDEYGSDVKLFDTLDEAIEFVELLRTKNRRTVLVWERKL